MRVVVVGDQFIPAAHYVDALADAPLDVRAVTWAGGKGEQHALQQLMERSGPAVVPPPVEILGAIGGAEAICLHFAPVSATLIAAAPKLRLIAVARSGLENVDVEAATAAGVAVVPSFGRNAGAVAELQLALLLAEARDIARADASVREGGWRKEFPGPAVELAGRTVGMVGFGQVGRVFAQRVAGFGCRLLAYDPYTSDDTLAAAGVERAGDLDHVFVDGDFVLVQARLTPETSRFIGAAQFRLMKRDAYFVNVSRSRLVDYDALYTALVAGRIAGAGLDVFDDEPLPLDSPWRRLDNVTITTHFGGDTEDTNTTSARLVADTVTEFARTGRAGHAVNAAALGW